MVGADASAPASNICISYFMPIPSKRDFFEIKVFVYGYGYGYPIDRTTLALKGMHLILQNGTILCTMHINYIVRHQRTR